MARIWERFLTERDRLVLQSAGYGVKAGYGLRPALLIIDVTYGFTGDRPEPILESIRRWNNSCGEEAWAAIPRIARLGDAFRARRLPVIYTAGEARDDNWDLCSWSWKNNRSQSLPSHPGNGRGVNEIVDELAPQPRDIVVRKQKPSAFFGTNMASYLTYLGCDSVIMTGCTTSGCVRASAIDSFSHNFRTIVVEDACFDRSEASHAIALFDLDCKHADVVTTDDVVAYASGLGNDLFPNLPG